MSKLLQIIKNPKKLIRKNSKAWKKKEGPYTVSLDGFLINDVICDADGWADAKKYLPQPYEMVKILTSEHTRNGWWNGLYWESLRLKPGEKILSWKVIKNETHIY